MSPHELGDVRDDVCSISLRKGKWLYSDRLYKGSGARRSAETPKSTSFRARPGIQTGGIAYKPPPPDPKPTSFRAWPGIQSISRYGSRINVTSQVRWRPGWRILEPGVQRTQGAWTAGNVAVVHARSSLYASPPPLAIVMQPYGFG